MHENNVNRTIEFMLNLRLINGRLVNVRNAYRVDGSQVVSYQIFTFDKQTHFPYKLHISLINNPLFS